MKAVIVFILLFINFAGFSQQGISPYIQRSRELLETNKFKESLASADSAVSNAIKLGVPDSLAIAYSWRVEVHKARKEYDKALDDFTVATLYNNSLDLLKSTAAQMVIRDSLRKEIEEHKKDISTDRDQIFSLQASADQNSQSLLIISIGVAVIFGVLLFIIYRRNNDLRLELSRSKEELLQMQSFRERLFMVISSDLKNSLSSFANLSQGLAGQMKSLSKEETVEFLNHLQTASNELKAMLNNIVHWVEYQANRSPFNAESFDSKIIAEQSIEKFQPQLDARKLSTHVFIPDNQTVFADKGMVEIVLNNLLSNAIQFTPAGGGITIFSGKKDGLVTIGVKDTGIGIEEANLAKLFDVKEDFKTIGVSNHKGAGVGLILCKDLVERNGGRIYVESTLGKGSNFYFTLPEKRIE